MAVLGEHAPNTEGLGARNGGDQTLLRMNCASSTVVSYRRNGVIK